MQRTTAQSRKFIHKIFQQLPKSPQFCIDDTRMIGTIENSMIHMLGVIMFQIQEQSKQANDFIVFYNLIVKFEYINTLCLISLNFCTMINVKKNSP